MFFEMDFVRKFKELHRKVFIVVMVFALFLGVQVAFGYILPARFYLRKLVASRLSVHRMIAQMKTTVFEGGKKRQFDEKLYIMQPGNIRLERRVKGKLVKVEIWRQRDAFVWEGHGELKPTKRQPQPRFDFFAIGPNGLDYGRLSYLLRVLKIHYRGTRRWDRESDYRLQTAVSLAWFGRAPAIVLGVRTAKRRNNQLWIDKKFAYPVRFIGRIAGENFLYDVKFMKYYTTVDGHLFPGITEVYRDGKIYLRAYLYRFHLNPRISSHLFSHLH